MNGSVKIQPTHLERQAIVYIRQSDPKQVLKNRESSFNQRALRERLLELGWKKHQVVVIDEDQGQSGKETTARAGFQALVAAISLRKVGIVMGYRGKFPAVVPRAGCGNHASAGWYWFTRCTPRTLRGRSMNRFRIRSLRIDRR
jgi:hypothetical protein